MNTEEIETIEDTIQDIPEEVKDFIFGEELVTAKEGINAYLETDEQKQSLSNKINLFLLGVISKDDLVNEVTELPILQEKKVAVWNAIQEKVINELLLTIEVAEELEAPLQEPSVISTDAPVSPTPNDVLASISARLNSTSVIAPTKRDYSIESSTSVTPPATSEPKTFDPYRELPEK